MSNPTFAFVTPSYAPDFNRCRLLCWSLREFVTFPIKHYIIVDRRDFQLFRQLADSRTEILTKEDVLPPWIRQLPYLGKKNIWFNLRGYKSRIWLMRGWLVQQIIKLSAAQYTTEDIIIFVDSDVAFINSFDPRSLVDCEGKVRLFRIEHSESVDPDPVAMRWRHAAKLLLGLPPDENYYDSYVSQVITWRRDNLLQLSQHIENNFRQNWMEVVASMADLSEYVLYGIFVNYVLGEMSGHYGSFQDKICRCYWKETPMSQEELKNFFQRAYALDQKAVMISAKSGMDLTIEQFQSCLAPGTSFGMAPGQTLSPKLA